MKVLLSLSVAIASIASVSAAVKDKTTTRANRADRRLRWGIGGFGRKMMMGMGKYGKNFNRVATYLICEQIDPTCDTDIATNAEIVKASDDGNVLVYSNSERESVGFVNITDPYNPVGNGEIEVGGEPTSVIFWNDYVLAVVNNSTDFVDVGGYLVAINSVGDVAMTWDLGGQPDAVDVSPDKNWIAVAIENERDEDNEDVDGGLPQPPPGYVVVIDASSGDPETFVPHIVNITGLDGILVPEDPEPEFVAINSDNIAVVTLQENNGIVLIDLPTQTVVGSFSAGSVDLMNIDTEEEPLINQTSSLTDVPREPDGVAWIGSDYFATANEGDWLGGSRGFSIFDKSGDVIFDSGSDADQIAASIGHYPDNRSGNKGTEPENVVFGTFEETDYVFVLLERAGLVLVYDLSYPYYPEFKQALPTGVGPEGGVTIPDRNIVAVSFEVDSRGDKLRSGISIYVYEDEEAMYPTLMSETDYYTGVPIPFGALSGLSPDPYDRYVLWTIEDSFYKKSRFFRIETYYGTPMITEAIRIVDTYDVFASFPPYGDFTQEDLDEMINDDGTVNIDPEGIATNGYGTFWIASEGRGTVGDPSRPIESLNFIFEVDYYGAIHKVISLPDVLNDAQLRFGLEGIAYHPDDYIFVCLQRAWPEFDRAPENPLILGYDIQNDEWIGAVQYPLDERESQNGGWVGLSDISYSGEGGVFYVLERDNQGGPDAAVKRIYSIDLDAAYIGGDFDVIEKTLLEDLIDLQMETGGVPLEKLEGLAVTRGGRSTWIVNDGDGVDDNSGEIQLVDLGDISGCDGPFCNWMGVFDYFTLPIFEQRKEFFPARPF